MLTDSIAESYVGGVAELSALDGARVLAQGTGDEYQRTVTPTLIELSGRRLPERAAAECFGPVTLVTRYDGTAELLAAIANLPSSLTGTVHTGAAADAVAAAAVAALRPIAGRLVFNGYPTGVVVSWAQQHGGPWPSTNSLHTSVGATAIRRFLRPQAWQSAPAELLPVELQDAEPGIPRRVDGVLRLPG
jgi:NADP-dependent aldehyde dehydrogenase